MPSQQSKGFLGWLRSKIWQRPAHDFGPRRGAVTHLVILDGTMSSLDPGCETNAGRAYQLAREMGSAVSIYYEPGLQWHDWKSTRDVMLGKGINRQIRRAYGYLASRYHPGDKIYFMGYSRGAYAVRSLAGIIDLIGLLRAEHATERNIRDAYRHYQIAPDTRIAQTFARTYCHERVEIEMIGVWDTVKSLGLNAPVLWRLTENQHAFHSHELSHNVRNGFHALALDETRQAYAPVLWSSPEGWQGRVEQVWFPGTHGDVGGQIGDFLQARPLSNIPFVWLMERAESCGLPLPPGWETRFDQDPFAPSQGTFRGYGKWFVSRRPRVTLSDPSERIHESVVIRKSSVAVPRRFIPVRKAV